MPRKPPKTGWHKQDIMASVRKKGTTLMRLSLEHGLHKNTLNVACNLRFPRAHAIIADFLGVPRHEIWPQFYHADGSLKTFRRVRVELAQGQARGRAA